MGGGAEMLSSFLRIITGKGLIWRRNGFVLGQLKKRLGGIFASQGCITRRSWRWPDVVQ
jgi:hypothetical protein